MYCIVLCPGLLLSQVTGHELYNLEPSEMLSDTSSFTPSSLQYGKDTDPEFSETREDERGPCGRRWYRVRRYRYTITMLIDVVNIRRKELTTVGTLTPPTWEPPLSFLGIKRETTTE